MQAEGHPIGMKRDTKEGLSTWVCGYSMLAGGEGDEQKAYDYINAFLADGTADYLVNSWGYGHSNQAAMDKNDSERSEESRVGNECVSTLRSRWWQDQ